MTNKKLNRRYYLHRKVKNEGYNIVVVDKTIYIPFNQVDLSKSVLELRDIFGYGIQTEIV